MSSGGPRPQWKSGVIAGLALAGALGVMGPLFAEPQPTCPLVYLPVTTAFPSSYDDTPDWAPPQDPLAPFDGKFDTRWATLAGVDNQSVYVDLGKPKSISKMVIYWERAYATEYELLVSDDAKTWKRLVLLQDQDGGTDEIAVPETTARYVKLIGAKRFHPDWGFSIWEMELYGCQASNPQDRPIEAVFPNQQRPTAMTLVFEEPLPSPGPVTPEEFHKGMVYLSFHENQLASPTSDAMLEELTKLHVSHVALVVTWYQNDLESTSMYAENPQGGRTPVDEALGHAMNKMHALGMKVMLKPHVDVQTGDFRGEIPASEEWFANYQAFIVRYAQLAERYHAELFCVGTELGGTSFKTWDAAWRRVIQAVREVYHGPIVYGANWDEYKQVPFWDAVDFIGIDAYFPLTDTDDPTKDQLVAAWERRANEIEAWRTQQQLKLPVIFTELGYGSYDGVNRTPWEWVTTKAEDQQEQADCLDAMLTVLARREWFKGLYYWNWFSQDIVSPLGYAIRGKLAEHVLASWYGTGGPQSSSTTNPEESQMKRSSTALAVTAAVALATSLGSTAIAAEKPTATPGVPSQAAASSSPAAAASAGPAKVLFGFENGPQGWGIPDWALEKTDMVARAVTTGKPGATEGKQALQVAVDFACGKWSGALVEVEEYFDWSPYTTLTVDVTLPADAPAGLKAKLILTVGENWEWTEARRALQLTPGQTTTLRASLAAGSEDWKRATVDDAFRKDVRKFAIRVESNKPAFQGTIAIDNVRLE